MNVVVWIVIGVVVILAVVAVAVALTRQQRTKRAAQAASIRENATERAVEVEQREALAEQSAAEARKAQADADAAAARAKLLNTQAREHEGVAAQSREELNSEFARADKIDPTVRASGTHVAGNERLAHEPVDDVAADHGHHRQSNGVDPNPPQR